jgi:hypothetical protein
LSLDGTPDGQAPETGGWQAAPVQAAYLGLPREAARLTSINFHDRFTYFTDNVNMQARTVGDDLGKSKTLPIRSSREILPVARAGRTARLEFTF